MKIVVLGNTGMLGHVVQYVLNSRGTSTYMSVQGVGRESLDVFPRSLNQLGTKLSYLFGFETDYIINCIGSIKPVFDNPLRVSDAIYTNAVFPRQLATWGELTNTKIIHITTDCVYDGWIGEYDEAALFSANEPYGMSKALGEPDNCMVLRTSIIGPEKGGRSRNFMSWLKSQDGQKIKGFTNHLWNGVTTLELARIIFDIIFEDLYEASLFHIFSDDMTKYEMVTEIIKQYDFSIEVEEYEHPGGKVNRTLRTDMGLNDLVIPQDFTGMIEELVEYEERMSKQYSL